MVVRLSKKRKRSKSSTSWCQPTYLTNIHHRLPKSRGGTSDSNNLSEVPVYLHEAYNALFGSNATAEEVVKVLSTVWIDPRYEIILIQK